MREWRLLVPTYYGQTRPSTEQDFGRPFRRVLIRREAGVRLVLGSFGTDGPQPDIYVERQPNGWVIFLHPVGQLDESGYVYMRDDGASFVLPESLFGATLPIELLRYGSRVPGFDPAP